MDHGTLSTAETNALDAESLQAFLGFSLSNTRAQVAEALSHFGRLGIFEEYTKHDISHVDGLLRIYDWLIPPPMRSEMTSAEWLLLTLASYFHDFGLLVTRAECGRRATTRFPFFKDEVLNADGADDLDYRSSVAQMPGDQREQFLYQEFVRHNHARRIRSWLSGHPDTALGYDQSVVEVLAELTANLDDVFVSDLGVVCESHHLDDLDNLTKYPLDRPYGQSRGETANVQYVSILLRAADLLHIRSDRTPTTAYRIISPRNPLSQQEWSKQQAVRSVRPKRAVDKEGNFDPAGLTDTVEIHARFTDASGFFGLTTYLQYAASQIKQCNEWAANSQKRSDRNLTFPWKKLDTSSIEAQGFIASPFEFQLDQRKILDLLTGHTLYNDTNVVLRELLQNSIDAVRLQVLMASERAEPLVAVRWNRESGELTVTDNGTGMSQAVIEQNFLRVGSSRYQEQQFVKQYPDFSPISRFGIGALSAFMIADDVEVLTVSPEDKQARLIALRSVHGQYLVKLIEKYDDRVPHMMREHGTRVRLKVRPSAQLQDVLEQLRSWIILPLCKVVYEEDGSNVKVDIGHASVAGALRESLVSSHLVKADGANLLRGTSVVEVRQNDDLPGLSVAYAVVWDEWHTQWSFLSIPESLELRSTRPDLRLGTCVEGIRVTGSSPGYRNMTLAAMANVIGRSAPKTDVSRSRFESTPELQEYLRKVYSVYSRHVEAEVEELQADRRCSLTKAVREASYLVRPLISSRSESNVESYGLLAEALEQVPALLVEKLSVREAMTTAQLRQVASLATVDSPITRHTEYLLAALPATSSTGSLLSALGVESDNFDGSEVLCTDLSFGYFSEQFLKYWSPVRVALDHETRTVRTEWKKATESSMWVSYNSADVYPAEFARLKDLDRPTERRTDNAPYAIVSGTVDVTGVRSDNAVSLGTRIYLLPSNPVYSVVASGDALAPESLSWFRSWLAGANYRRFFSRRDDRTGSSEFVAYLDAAGCGKYIDLSSVRDMVADYRIEVFDSSRWDRWPKRQARVGGPEW
jgi:molecular chaperone HtpG